MKTILYFFFGILLLASCNKTNPLPDDEPFEDNSFAVMKNGEWLPIDFVSAIRLTENGVSHIVIQAYTDGSSSEAVSLILPMETGTFNMLNPDDGIPHAMHFLANNEDTGYSISGTMTITSHNQTTRRVKGTFSFTTQSLFIEDFGYSFTNGSFDVEYIN